MNRSFKRNPFIFTLSISLFSLNGCHPTHPVTYVASSDHLQPQTTKYPFSSSQSIDTSRPPHVIGLRKFPYPYQAMVAIASDADHETQRKFNLVHQFLNTNDYIPAIHHYGLGLDIADSFFMYNGTNIPAFVDYHHEPMTDELSWFKQISNQPYAAQLIKHYIQVGWIDTIHSYGDFSQIQQNHTLFTRQLAANGVAALSQNQVHIDVWSDHGNKSNVDNFGSFGISPFYSYQQGANPHSPYYHTDLTIPYGIHYVWTDQALSQFGEASTLYPLRLPDGRTVWGYWRYTNAGYTSHGSPEWNWSVNGLSNQITMNHLKQLETNHFYVIIAQHLEAENEKFPLPGNAIDAFWLLADEYQKGHLLVARTSRLLHYNEMQQYIRYSVTYQKGIAYIHILRVIDPVLGSYLPTPEMLHGLTFYTTNPAKTVLELGDTPIPSHYIQYNASDGIHTSIAIKWYPRNTQNYTKNLPNVY